ncbi:hypothetical protein [Methanocalculus sp.]|jgi:hypothetical protein|uniref:DUF7289 family protein n=1 Tax=Methanocalculus sp. TaxID=2004547 RepID=UPI001819BF92|nr:hypothetical protein [Methanocalculus sp.]HIJ06388.1 hypothetical protein [Methanocalculus sp.]
MRNDEGVSEAIGFILIFSIVVIGIAIVVMYGFPLLVAGQGSADMRNMEQTMIVLQNDLKSISYKMVPYKETALQVQGGMLFVTGDSGSFEVLVNGTSVYESSVGQIRYVSDLDRTRITIENGAVLTRPGRGAGSAMIAEPRWYYDDHEDILILSFIEIETERERALSGVGRIEMKSDPEKKNTTEYAAAPGSLEIRYSPLSPEHDYSVAWENYLTGRLGMVRESDNVYTHPSALKLVVQETVISITGF